MMSSQGAWAAKGKAALERYSATEGDTSDSRPTRVPQIKPQAAKGLPARSSLVQTQQKRQIQSVQTRPSAESRVQQMEAERKQIRGTARKTAKSVPVLAPVRQAAGRVPVPLSPSFDPVPKEQRGPIAERLELIEELIRKHGRAYDYRKLTTRQLTLILAKLNRKNRAVRRSAPEEVEVDIELDDDEIEVEAEFEDANGNETEVEVELEDDEMETEVEFPTIDDYQDRSHDSRV